VFCFPTLKVTTLLSKKGIYSSPITKKDLIAVNIIASDVVQITATSSISLSPGFAVLVSLLDKKIAVRLWPCPVSFFLPYIHIWQEGLVIVSTNAGALCWAKATRVSTTKGSWAQE
jgi:hypothetical protein